MDKQLIKRRRGDDDDGSEITIDRLSQLPQPILHQILSLLSQKDAIRTCVLSKSWRYLWHGRLNFEFSDFYHGLARKEEIWPFLDKTLQGYLDQNFSLQKFLIDIYYYEFDLVFLQKWIPVLIMKLGVRSLSLMFSYGAKAYPLPSVVFQSESLVELHLQHCNLRTLKPNDNVMLNNLQTLRLHNVDIIDKILEKILSGCPLIENLDLLECIGLKSIKLHKHHKIKGFGCSVDDNEDQIIIEIEDPQTYESVHIQNCQDWFFRHKNMHFPHLKTLDLYKVPFPAETLNNFSSFFPCVNELILNKCHGVKDFLLLSSSIKPLTIIMDMRNKIKAFIDTPNILYFKYDGFLPTIKFATTSNEWKSKISLCYKLKPLGKDSTSWFLKLNKFLNALCQSHITLRLTNKNLHIKDLELLGWFCKPVVVKYLKLLGWFYHPSGPAILNCFFRICRPRYIHMDCYDKELIELLCNPIPKEKGSYFWLQDLEEVSIQVWDMMAGKWHCVPTSLAALPGEQPIRFRLTWNEQLSNLPS
ncbi:hypothetical protein CASFOL_021988 [Castilleja foliolosa]|uniref:F-box domain-containing protein n=1 Tax=Castilleja foliolosa TaxID=1961234 RepID=A0ABD3CZG1_9LAMI